MNWNSVALRSKLQTWLKSARQSRYTPECKLDPFSTSMRNFDDVSPNLKAIRNGKPLSVADASQRVADLRSSGLVGNNGKSLSTLGYEVLRAWEQFGVDNNDLGDEMSRLLLLVLIGHDIEDDRIEGYISYWRSIRESFPPLDLIDSWDKLYVLNYLDASIDGFSPGAELRRSKASINDVAIDLLDSFEALASDDTAVEGASRIKGAIRGKIPRGRHRATFCMALEIAVAGPSTAIQIIKKFGIPTTPRVWIPFSADQEATLMSILDEFASDGAATVRTAENDIVPSAIKGAAAGEHEPELVPFVVPDISDFSNVLIEAPKRVAIASPAMGMRRRNKINHTKRAKQNSLVGSAGEEFALKFEKWRLKDHPDLAGKIVQVSKEDDSLGYDILSFETNGSPRYLEIKSTLGKLENMFYISSNELSAADSLGSEYIVLRVAQLGSAPVCCEIRHPFHDKLTLTPSTYMATFA